MISSIKLHGGLGFSQTKLMDINTWPKKTQISITILCNSRIGALIKTQWARIENKLININQFKILLKCLDNVLRINNKRDLNSGNKELNSGLKLNWPSNGP
jgi:hypothetical protein